MDGEILEDPKELHKLEKRRKLESLEENLQKKSMLWEKRHQQKKQRMDQLMDEEKLKIDQIFIDKLREEARNE